MLKFLFYVVVVVEENSNLVLPGGGGLLAARWCHSLRINSKGKCKHFPQARDVKLEAR